SRSLCPPASRRRRASPADTNPAPAAAGEGGAKRRMRAPQNLNDCTRSLQKRPHPPSAPSPAAAGEGNAWQDARMMIREMLENIERDTLAPRAARSSETRGRDRDEPEDDLRPSYQRDRDRILHCKSFRRLKHKTQVFLAPEGDHYRTRLTHVLEVTQIARTIAKSLRLHEVLHVAILPGHRP